MILVTHIPRTKHYPLKLGEARARFYAPSDTGSGVGAIPASRSRKSRALRAEPTGYGVVTSCRLRRIIKRWLVDFVPSSYLTTYYKAVSFTTN